MKIFFFLSFIFIVLQNAIAQSLTFERTYSNAGLLEGHSVEQTYDGGYIVAGRRNSNGDGTLMKTDSFGDIEWIKIYGSAINYDLLCDVKETRDSGFIACGYIMSSATLDDIYIIKTDKNGDTLWTNTWATNAMEAAVCVIQTHEGDYIVAGNHNGQGLLMRLTQYGDTLWTSNVHSLVFLSSVVQTADSCFVATGWWNSYNPALNGQLYVVKIDKYGNIVWEKNYGDTREESGSSIKYLPDGNFLVGGIKEQIPNRFESYLLKLNSFGDTIWTKVYSSPKDNYITGLDLCQDGGFIFSERKEILGNYQISMVRIDSLGNILWEREYGGEGTDGVSDILTCYDGGFVLCGAYDAYNNSKLYLIKTDESGILSSLPNIEFGSSKNTKIKVSPNPFVESIDINLSELPNKEYNISLYDALGKHIMSKISTGGSITTLFIYDTLPKGVYFLKIFDKKNTNISISLIHN